MAANDASKLVPSLASEPTGGLSESTTSIVLGLFAPTIHSLRLHYVEFFGKFYSGGGQRYRPFAHWGLSNQRIDAEGIENDRQTLRGF